MKTVFFDRVVGFDDRHGVQHIVNPAQVCAMYIGPGQHGPCLTIQFTGGTRFFDFENAVLADAIMELIATAIDRLNGGQQ